MSYDVYLWQHHWGSGWWWFKGSTWASHSAWCRTSTRLHIGDLKAKGLRLGNFFRPGQVLHQGHEFMVLPTVIVVWSSRWTWSWCRVLQPFVGVLECKAHFPGDSLSIVEEDILFLLPASCPPSCAQHAAYPPRHRSAWSLPPHTAQSQRRSSRSRLSSRALGAGAALREDQWAGRAARQGPGMTACSTGRERGQTEPAGHPKHRSACQSQAGMSSQRLRGSKAVLQL